MIVSHWTSAARTFALATAVLALAALAGCGNKGYRAEVHSTGEGRYDVTTVPTAPPGSPDHPGQARVEVKDPDLHDVIEAWPKLSMEDRKRVADTARRLAQGTP